MPTKPKFPFVRPLHWDDPNGTDVQAIKRALSRAGYMTWKPFSNRFDAAVVEALKKFQKDHHIQATGNYGKRTHNALVKAHAVPPHPGEAAFDEYAGELLWGEYLRHTEDNALTDAKMLLGRCRMFTGPYIWGGGHGVPLSQLPVSEGMDCSGSTCKALYDRSLYQPDYATNSAGMESYGEAGRGKYVTIHANWEHVWVEFTLPDGWYRFDTSPHGDGPRGPRVRTGRRFDTTFVHRHPKGM